AKKFGAKPLTQERLFRRDHAERRRTDSTKRDTGEVDPAIAPAAEQHRHRDDGKIAMPARDLGAAPTGICRRQLKIDRNQQNVRRWMTSARHPAAVPWRLAIGFDRRT